MIRREGRNERQKGGRRKGFFYDGFEKLVTASASLS